MIIQGTAIKGMTVSSSAAGLITDSYFNLVSLLLPGNGTNGAQNNTFLDSSASPLTVTRNGSVTQGAFSPFTFGSGTQTDGYYSGYFDGTGDYLTVADNTAFEFGSGDFTIEGWFYALSVASDTAIVSKWTATGTANSNSWLLFVTSGVATFLTSTNGSAVDVNISGGTVTVNSWNHIAVSRSGNTYSLYLNGTRTATTTNSNSLADVATVVAIGRYGGGTFGYMNGYISNARIVKGSAVYDPTQTSITVPTSPLTNITNTSLLTCQSSQFIDNSTNAFAITSFGNSQPTVVNPFGMTDWSGYFDGTGDYLSVASNAAFAPGTGDFTFEAWINPTTLSTISPIFVVGANGGLWIGKNGSNFVVRAYGIADQLQVATLPSTNQWTYIAVTRSGTTLRMFYNGLLVGSTTNSYNFIQSGLYIAHDNGVDYYAGNISNLRFIKGTALYTSNFTPPTAPLTAISGTSLLTCQSSTFIDNSTNAFPITVNGNSYTLTLNNPFNSPVNYDIPALQYWSNYFDGTGDYLSTADNASLDLGTSDFCIEGWFFLESTTEETIVAKWGATASTNSYLVFVSSGDLYFFTSTNGLNSDVSLSSPVTTNGWYHFAAVRSGSSYALFLNGARVATVTNSNTIYDSASGITIGRYTGGSLGQLNGYVSNIRIVKGTAVYSPAQSTITVPTSPLSAVANTVLLTCQSNRFVDNSINQLAITRAGDTSVQPFSPFDPTAAYSTSSIGASMYFDGASKLTTSASIDISGVFTIESWFNSTNGGGWFFTIGNFPVYIDVSAGTVTLDKSSVGNQLVTTANEQVKGSNCWKHLAITRDGSGLIRVFVNGVLLGSVSTSYSAGTLNGLGQYASYGGAWLGYACDFRVVVGTALYTSAFTPPTAPLTAVSGTAILLSGINAGITDAAAKNVLETVGGAAISTTQSKFGGSAMYFDGVDDNAIIPYNPIFSLGTADFTVEGWFYFSNISTTRRGIVALGDGANGGGPYSAWSLTYLGSEASNQIALSRYDGTSYDYATSGFTISANTWYHIAVARYSGVLKIFVNGISYYSNTVTTNFNAVNTNPLRIGLQYYGPAGGYGGPRYWNGYINDLRITRGYARYTANFTPPTAAFPTQ